MRTQQAELDRTKQSLVQSDQEVANLQAQLEQARAEGRRLLDENLDLAARLTTAQIRRLQVEKILLESRIDEQRTASATAQAQVSGNP